MKTVLICNIILRIALAFCITAAAMHFDKAAVLWWYLLLPFLGWTYEHD